MTDKIFSILTKEDFLKQKSLQLKIIQDIEKSRQQLVQSLKKVGKSNDIKDIIDCEQTIIEYVLANRANSPEQTNVLNKSLNDIEVVQELIKDVQKPDIYQVMAKAFRKNKNNIKGLPNDEARHFFKSQRTRIANESTGQKSITEKEILNERRNNMRKAEELYISMQEKALGIDKQKEKNLGLSL